MSEKESTELSKEEQAKLKNLFDHLDKNKDGRIDFKELNDYYNYLNKSEPSKDGSRVDARRLFERINSDDSKSQNIEFQDFLDYVGEKDKKIKLFLFFFIIHTFSVIYSVTLSSQLLNTIGITQCIKSMLDIAVTW